MNDEPDTGGDTTSAGASAAAWLARGVCRALAARGDTPFTEVTLNNGRRADVLAVDGRGTVSIVEIKTSRTDFRSDGKWDAYRAFCDRFYFGVPRDFPTDILPGGEVCGLMIADGYDAAIVREAPTYALSGARRRALVLRVARHAGQRLLRLHDPDGAAAARGTEGGGP